MLIHPTLDKLKSLKFYGMAQGLQEQAQHPAIEQLSFEERLKRPKTQCTPIVASYLITTFHQR
jgi:hypothetical protein